MILALWLIDWLKSGIFQHKLEYFLKLFTSQYMFRQFGGSTAVLHNRCLSKSWRDCFEKFTFFVCPEQVKTTFFIIALLNKYPVFNEEPKRNIQMGYQLGFGMDCKQVCSHILLKIWKIYINHGIQVNFLFRFIQAFIYFSLSNHDCWHQ